MTLNTAIDKLETVLALDKKMIEAMSRFKGANMADVIVTLCQNHVVDLECVLNDLKMIDNDIEIAAEELPVSVPDQEYTNKIINAIDDGNLDAERVTLACLKWMGEREVKDMVEHNNFYIDADE